MERHHRARWMRDEDGNTIGYGDDERGSAHRSKVAVCIVATKPAAPGAIMNENASAVDLSRRRHPRGIGGKLVTERVPPPHDLASGIVSVYAERSNQASRRERDDAKLR